LVLKECTNSNAIKSLAEYKPSASQLSSKIKRKPNIGAYLLIMPAG